MKANEKKSYQFYFKKLETPTTSKDNQKSQFTQTSPYLKYDTSEKLRLSSNVQSGNKSIQNDRGIQTYALQKKAGLYSSEYTPGKLGLNRQHYKSGDTGQKYVPKYITPKNTQLTPEGNMKLQKQKAVKQFTPLEQIAGSTIVDNERQSMQRREQTGETTVNLESVNVESRNARLTDFLNTTMGKSTVLWNDINLRRSTHSYSGHSQVANSINNNKKEGYYAGMERFKQNLKQQEMKTSTLLTVKDNDDVGQCGRERSFNIPHVESKVFLNDGLLVNSNKGNIDCKKCDELTRKWTQSQKQVQQLYSKRHHTMQQIYKQYSTIKEQQQTELKLKQQLQSNAQEVNQLKVSICSFEKTILLMNEMNEKLSLQIKSLQKLKQEQVNQLTCRYEQLLRKQRENVGNYMSCITQLNDKVEEMDGELAHLERELTQKYQSKIKEIKEAGLKELEVVRYHIEGEMQKVKQSYQSHIKDLEKEQQVKLTALQQSHLMQMSKLGSQLQDAKTYSQQVPYLTQILVKLQSQLVISQTQKSTLSNQCQSLSNELIKLSSVLQAKQQQLQLLVQNMGKLARENEQKDRQFQKVLLQLQAQRLRQRERRLPSAHEEEWLSISPSTSSIKQQQGMLTSTFSKELCAVESPIKQAINNQKTFTQLNTKFLQISASNTNLTQQLQITSSQLDSNANQMSQMDESLAKYASQIQSLQQTIKVCRSQIEQKDNIINQSKQIIVELNDKVITLKKELYPSDEIIHCPQRIEDQSAKHQGQQSGGLQQQQQEHENQNDGDMIACLTQQLQQKQWQLAELQQQLQQSLDIINLLKNQLTNNKVQQLQQNQTHFQQQHHPYNIQQQQQSLSSHSYQRQNKQILLNQYFTKIQDYYNQILQIFGLQLIHHTDLQLENLSSSLSTPRKGDQFVEKSEGQNDIQDEQQRKEKKQLANINDGQQMKVQSLTMFEHQNAVGSQSVLIQNKQYNKSPQQLPQPQPSPQTHPYNSLSEAFQLLSQNQQQMLKIINQWIRKLQRQSSSIRQYKQKCQYLQQQVTHFTQENSQLSSQKLEIYDKYEAFILKLEAENNEQEEKMHMMGEKMMEMQGYVKELEEAIYQTNKECMIGGLLALEMRKQHSTFGRLIQKSLLTHQDSQVQIEKNELKQSDVQQFYSQHQLVRRVSLVSDQPLHKPKSQTEISGKQQGLQKQNQQGQVSEETKIKPLDEVSNTQHLLGSKQVIIDNY